jgi:oligo-1,6-glucosidase
MPAIKNILLIATACLSFHTSFGQDKTWWKGTVVYQVYPQSFKDANGDGVGDLKGIGQKLDYLQQLGIETIWINPFYKSPGHDNGYDIADYRAINPQYGTMQDFDRLLSALKKRKMHLVMDMVLNHTSDEHPWFKAAKTSRDNPYHDFYLWKPGKKDSLPNNWPSIFGGSAWKWNEATQEYYLHTFIEQQPDLNWDNPKVRQELYKIMRFWLDKGVDGFRFDAISVISKNRAFPSMDFSNGFLAALNGKINDGPHLHEYLAEMNRQVLSPYHVYTVGEVYTDKDSAWEFVAPARKELSAINFFDAIRLPDSNRIITLKAVLDGWNAALQSRGYWNTVILSTHDFPRALSRIGDDGQYREPSAKMLATLLLTYRGTPFIFQGEELGMTNYPFKEMAELKDITAHTQFDELTKTQGLSDSAAFVLVRRETRDNARTPMQWDSTKNAGFTSGTTPWLKVNPNYSSINAVSELSEPGSVLRYYQKLLSFRKRHPTLIYGSFEDISPGDPSIYAYTRTSGKEQWLIILNMTGNTVSFQTKNPGTFMLSNYPSGATENSSSWLRPYEARIYKTTITIYQQHEKK